MTQRWIVVCALSTVAATVDAAQYCGTTQWEPYIAEAAEHFALPPHWLHAVMRAESAGCVLTNGQPTTSSAGAMGLMQLMPVVWREQRERLQLGDDPHAPRDNILAGASYLRELYDRYGWPGASAAYHAGPKRYGESLTGGRALPATTRQYLAHIEHLLQNSAQDGPRDDASKHSGSSPNPPPNRSVFAAPIAQASSRDEQAQLPSRSAVFVRLRYRDSHATGSVSESENVQQP